MGKRWSLELLESYRGMNVPVAVLAERERLDALLTKHCEGPYDADGTELGLGLFLEGAVGRPFDFGGIRLEYRKVGPIYGNIYVRKTDWDVPLASYRLFLWKIVESAIFACISKLKKRGSFVDEEKLRSHLALVESEFLGEYFKSGAPDSAAAVEAVPVDRYAKDEEHRVVVQYRIEGHGDKLDHDKRVEIEDMLAEFLESGDLGYCDGGDIGSGTMNVFCFVKPGQKAVQGIIDTLRRHHCLDGAVVAETVGGEEKVVWPTDFSGEFQLV